MSGELHIRRVIPADLAWVRRALASRWGSHLLISRGKETDGSACPGFIAERDQTPVGLVTLHLKEGECEVLTLDSFDGGKGIGKALMAEALQFAKDNHCARLWLITSNDNINALRFYQRIGMRLSAVHLDAITRAREVKPTIPLIGEFGIPLRDEIELEIKL